jgi:hypothetical protein
MRNNELTERDLDGVSGGGFCNTFLGGCTSMDVLAGMGRGAAAGAGAGVEPPVVLHEPTGGGKGSGGGIVLY